MPKSRKVPTIEPHAKQGASANSTISSDGLDEVLYDGILTAPAALMTSLTRIAESVFAT